MRRPTFARGSLVLLCCLAGADASHAGSASVCDGVSEATNTTLQRVVVATGLSSVLLATAPPADTDRVFLVEQGGRIRFIQRGSTNPAVHTLFLDISTRVLASGEQGLLGLAFDPDFADNGFFYVHYARAGDGANIVSRFGTLDGTPNTNGDPASERVLLRIPTLETNHNGGWLGFGPDGYLYIAIGDGGGSGDPHGTCGNGQSLTTLLGKMLRIDPRGGPGRAPDCGLDPGPYTIPMSNPLDNGAGGTCDEIWAYGLRNPWRPSFDRGTGDFYIADVEQNCWEEINWASVASTGGENYGWRQFEGRHCYAASQGCAATTSPAGCGPSCSDLPPVGDPLPNGTTLPVWDYDHGSGCSVTGGYVYRGCRMPNIRGQYFYGDLCASSVRSFEVVGGVATNHRDWTSSIGGVGDILSFGEDAQGEHYICNGDTVYKIVPPLGSLEVSGNGAGSALLSSASGDWTWEDLFYTAAIPISSYRVWRADIADGWFDVGELFECVFTTAAPGWSGGDPEQPSPGAWFAYVVTAVDAAGNQTSPGGTPPRSLSTAPCL